ncbi:50S ribosomal protein L10 [Buchnera aphidicola]
MLDFKKKKELVTQINLIAKTALSIVVANPQGIKSNDITQLRKLARKSNVKLGVYRNTLLNLGIKNTPFECLKNILIGPTLIAYSSEHPGSAAKLLKNFSMSQSSNPNFKILGAVFEGKAISGSNINSLADIPTFNEALRRFIIIAKEISAGKLLRILVSIKNIKENS